MDTEDMAVDTPDINGFRDPENGSSRPESGPPRTARHETARRYADAGIPVFVCGPDVLHRCPPEGKCEICERAKSPATPHGFKDATTSIEQIDCWFAEADYNLAVCPEDAGWAVIDLDDKNGKTGSANWQALAGDKPDTYTAATPSGGRHLYRHSPDSRRPSAILHLGEVGRNEI